MGQKECVEDAPKELQQTQLQTRSDERTIESPTIEPLISPESDWETFDAGITISGRPGAGNTDLARRLSERLNRKLITTGQIFRSLFPDEQVVGYRERDLEIDRKNDQMQKGVIRTATPTEPVILEGKIAGPLASEEMNQATEEGREIGPIVRILLVANTDTRARRVAAREGITISQARKQSSERMRRDLEQYRKLHPQLEGIDPWGPDNKDKNGKPMYDSVINTTNLTLDDEEAIVLKYMIDHKLLRKKQQVIDLEPEEYKFLS